MCAGAALGPRIPFRRRLFAMRWMTIGVLAFLGAMSTALADPPPPPPSGQPVPRPPPAKDEKKAEPEAQPKAEPKKPEGLVGTALDLALEVDAPKYVVVNQPFTVEVKAHNVGHLTLAGVTGAMRASGSTKTVSGSSTKHTAAKLEPGRHWVIKETFIAQKTGPTRIGVSFREERGWAASGALVEPSVQATPPPKSGKRPKAKTRRLDMKVGCEDVKFPQPGKPFAVTLWVENTGDVDLDGVLLAVRPEGGVTISAASKTKLAIKKLAKGERRELTLACTLARKAGPKTTLLTSAREQRGWTAAGLRLPIHKKP